MSPNEVLPPCLYLLWPVLKRAAPEVRVPPGYAIRNYHERDEQGLWNLLRSDGETITDLEWHHYRDMLLPNGLFLAESLTASELVATAGAVHNPNPGREYFSFGGELGYAIVAHEHRRRGLGRAVCAVVIKRFLSAGYENIRVCVQEDRLPAVRLYLRLGFEPYLHSANVEARWQQVYATLGLPFTPDQWSRKT
jgi:mycothiol synthase